MEFNYSDDRIFLLNDKNETIAEVTFPQTDENTVTIDHTYVDSSLRGQGVASKLLYSAAEYLRNNNKKVIPTCSYAVEWFKKHKEYSNILK